MDLEKENYLVPPRICRKLLISGLLFPVVGYFSIRRGFISLGILVSSMYITTLWHWTKPKKKSIARMSDIFLVIIVLIYATYHSFIIPNIKTIWFYSLSIQVFGYSVNDIIFTYRIDLYPLYLSKNVHDNAYEFNIWVHMICVHIIPSLTSIYCLTR